MGYSGREGRWIKPGGTGIPFSAFDVHAQLHGNPHYISDGLNNSRAVLGSITVTGGTITNHSDNVSKVHTFTSDGTYTSNTKQTVEILVVAGGGGGGGYSGANEGGGGGGAGGVVYASTVTLPAGSYAVTVGAGGVVNGGDAEDPGPLAGGNSSFIGGSVSLIAQGGGPGGNVSFYEGRCTGVGQGDNCATTNGGSGGGGRGMHRTTAGGSSTQTVQSHGIAAGKNGGKGNHFTQGGGGGGGGGGATTAGDPSNGNFGGQGGRGVSYRISGSTVYYAEGGQGGFGTGAQPSSPPTGGIGQQGNGGTGYGMGGGGGWGRSHWYNLGGNGSWGATPGTGGVVIIRRPGQGTTYVTSGTFNDQFPDGLTLRDLHEDHYVYAHGENQINPTSNPVQNSAAAFRDSSVYGMRIRVMNESVTATGGERGSSSYDATNHYSYYQNDNAKILVQMIGGSRPGTVGDGEDPRTINWKVAARRVYGFNEDTGSNPSPRNLWGTFVDDPEAYSLESDFPDFNLIQTNTNIAFYAKLGSGVRWDPRHDNRHNPNDYLHYDGDSAYPNQYIPGTIIEIIAYDDDADSATGKFAFKCQVRTGIAAGQEVFNIPQGGGGSYTTAGTWKPQVRFASANIGNDSTNESNWRFHNWTAWKTFTRSTAHGSIWSSRWECMNAGNTGVYTRTVEDDPG